MCSRSFCDQVHRAIQPMVQVEVQLGERLGTGDGIVAVVQPDGQQMVPARTDPMADLEAEGEIATHVTAEALAVEPNLGDIHGTLEAERHRAPFGLGAHSEPAAVPADPLPVRRGHEVLDPGRVRQRRGLPRSVVQLRPLRTCQVGSEEPPPLIQAIDPPTGAPLPSRRPRRRSDRRRCAGRRHPLKKRSTLHREPCRRPDETAGGTDSGTSLRLTTRLAVASRSPSALALRRSTPGREALRIARPRPLNARRRSVR